MPVVKGRVPADFGAVGFIGLGDMGGPMADNLIDAGFDMTVFDTRSEPLQAARARGAQVADSLVALATRCRSIGVCVWSDEQLHSVVLGPGGLIEGGARELTLIVHSTVRPTTIEAIAKAFEPKGWQVVDAPVSGGRAASLTGTLSLMVGGETALYERLLPYLNTVGQHLFHVGTRPGLGEVAKLCNNLMGLCNAFAIVEALKLARAYGVDDEAIRQVAAVSTGSSWYIEHWGFFDDLIQHHPQPDVLYKDLWEAVFAGKEKGVPLVLTGVAAMSAPRLIEERLAQLRAAPDRSQPRP